MCYLNSVLWTWRLVILTLDKPVSAVCQCHAPLYPSYIFLHQSNYYWQTAPLCPAKPLSFPQSQRSLSNLAQQITCIPLLPMHSCFFPRYLVLSHVHLPAIKPRLLSQETVVSLCVALYFKQGSLLIVDSVPRCNMLALLHPLFVFIPTFSLMSSTSLCWMLIPGLLQSHTL